MIDLNGEWTLSDATGSYTCPMRLPGDGITALHEAGLIPDPYFGRNEYGLRWIAERDWTIRRTFTLDRTDLVLVLDGIDTVATVFLNGVEVRRTANAFRKHIAAGVKGRTFAEAGVLRVGENEVAITFHSATAEAVKLAAAQPFPVPYTLSNNPIPHGNMLRKPGCDWGWDWNIALVPFGVTGGIHLSVPGIEVEQIKVRQIHQDGAVSLRITASADCQSFDGFDEPDFPYRVECAGQVAEGIALGGFLWDVTLDIPNPALWWPAGHGPQTLHDLTITMGDVTETRRIGLRTIELVTERDAAGLGFKFRVNGRDIFAKGANWIPADALSGRITPAKTRALLQSAVDANMNMIRVWGGGRYEPDSFYDACDELGLLVWQDAMFSCNLYPSTPEFLREVEVELRENAARLAHHACLALWCGDNELIGALTWFDESRNDRDRYLVSYDRLNRTIERAIKSADPAANWWPSSPSAGPLNFRDAWHEDGSGDMHFWSVWHEGRDFDHYRDVSPRFCSEFGFQSYPSMPVIETFTGPQDRNIASPVFESHQKNKGGNARIAETMFRYFRWPEKFADFVWLSQIQQGLAIKTAVTHWRSLKPHCMGTLIWQLNDTWPVCSWSSLDYGGGWKLLHYMARSFFAPVIVTAVPGAEGIALMAVNDTAAPLTLEVAAHAVTVAGMVRPLGTHLAVVTPDGAHRVALLPTDALAPDELLGFTWRRPGGPVSGDVHAPQPWKAYDLLPPRLTHSATAIGTGWEITVTAKALALFVTLEADQPGRFSQNAFALFPGYPATVTFTPDMPGSAPTFALRDLHSATFS